MHVELPFGSAFEQEGVSALFLSEFFFELCILTDQLMVFLLESLAFILETVATEENGSVVVD